MTPSSTPDPGFTPRKEFIKDARTVNSFCLLTLSGVSLIRLYSFPTAVVASLRRLLDQRDLTQTYRENTSLNFCEFNVDGKPWASPKTVNSEKLLVDIIAILFQHGHSFLSTIDYGRENDDRLAIAFSKPASLPTRTPPASPIANGSVSSQLQQTAVKRVPWALSFASATTIRVICPPLHSTPAILQAVRGAWPRGVVSEKKVGDASYEFKLKGYKWFQEDTFATDSLHHILSLLSSLDSHAFSLLASISLTNRSRVKDLWMFTGPAPESSDSEQNSARESSSSVPPNPDLRSLPTETGVGGTSQHRRYATTPAGGKAKDADHTGHLVRAATEQASQSRKSPSSPTTQKGPFNRQATTQDNIPAPLAVKPTGYREGGRRDQERAAPMSAIPSGIENMTGIGATAQGTHTPERGGGVIYATGKVSTPTSPRNPSGRSRSPSPQRNSHRTSSPRPQSPLRSSSSPKPPASPTSDKSPAPQLLGVGVFAVGSTYRNSELSSNTEVDVKSCEIPIAWTGNDDNHRVQDLAPISENPKTPKAARISVGPILPGGWQSTPEDEQPSEMMYAGKQTVAKASQSLITPVQEVDAHVASPELMVADEQARKSQVGSVGVIPSAGPPPAMPSDDKDVTKSGQLEKRGSSPQGWVLVNVESKGRKRGKGSGSGHSDIVTVPTPKSNETALDAAPETSKDAALSAVAKAIVMVDAVEAKKEKAKSSGFKRFFAKNKSRKLGTDDETSNPMAPSPTGANGTPIPGEKNKELPKRPEVRGKLRRGSTL